MIDQVNIWPDEKRASYDRLLATIGNLYGVSSAEAANTFKVYESNVEMGVYLSPNVANYSMSPRKTVFGTNTPNGIETEVKLDQNDWFCITGIGLRFGKTDYASTSNSYSNSGNYPRFTYPDAVYFNGVPATGKPEWQCLQAIINGSLSLTVTGDVVLESLDCQDLVYKGTTGYSATGPVLAEVEMHRAYHTQVPQILLNANSDNLFQVSLAPNSDIGVIDGRVNSSGAGTTSRNILWVCLKGYKIKNAANGGVNPSVCRV